jgi:hypothetical protein
VELTVSRAYKIGLGNIRLKPPADRLAGPAEISILSIVQCCRRFTPSFPLTIFQNLDHAPSSDAT